MIFDSHSHTAFSADSEMKAADAIAMAEKAGVGLVFTEHLDLDYPGDVWCVKINMAMSLRTLPKCRRFRRIICS